MMKDALNMLFVDVTKDKKSIEWFCHTNQGLYADSIACVVKCDYKIYCTRRLKKLLHEAITNVFARDEAVNKLHYRT